MKINLSSALGLCLGVVFFGGCPGPVWCLHGSRFSRFGETGVRAAVGDSVVTSFAGQGWTASGQGLCSLAPVQGLQVLCCGCLL